MKTSGSSKWYNCIVMYLRRPRALLSFFSCHNSHAPDDILFAGTFTLLGCLISLWHLTSHLRHYYKPDVQRRVMAVLWMVPIYSVTSWFSLVFPRLVPRSYLNIIFLTLSALPSSVNHLISRLICWYKACCTVNVIFNSFFTPIKMFLTSSVYGIFPILLCLLLFFTIFFAIFA